MKFKVIIALLLMILTFSSSALAYSVYFIEKNKDEFSGTTTIKGHVVVKTSFPDPNAIEVSIVKTIPASGTAKYLIFIAYENTQKALLNIPKGESLFFIINNEGKLALSGDGSEGHKYLRYMYAFSMMKVPYAEISTVDEENKKNASSLEELSYPISIEDLHKLAQAKEIKFKIQGENSFIYSLDKDNIQDIKRFMNEYGEKQP